jgi:branched-subunit amino acid aminotransferase/4-amino-4-deoxychorismate lyase
VTRLIVWRPDARGLGPHEEVAEGPTALEVADSWLVEDGWARGLALHRARFASSCRELGGIPAGPVEEMLDAAVAAIPVRGRWFPRVERGPGPGGEHELRLRLRPAPPPDPSPVAVWVGDRPDPRTRPRVKGPDLEQLAALREEARGRGAGEALLRDGSGVVLEGALSGLLWWRDGVLCAPDPELPVLPSVTSALLVGLAGRAGLTVRRERRRLEELAGLETWVVSALHGVRPVSRWVGAGVEPGQPRRADQWARRLRALGERLPGAQATSSGPIRP